MLLLLQPLSYHKRALNKGSYYKKTSMILWPSEKNFPISANSWESFSRALWKHPNLFLRIPWTCFQNLWKIWFWSRWSKENLFLIGAVRIFGSKMARYWILSRHTRNENTINLSFVKNNWYDCSGLRPWYFFSGWRKSIEWRHQMWILKKWEE